MTTENKLPTAEGSPERLVRPFWLSWIVRNYNFELHSPWWISGEDPEGNDIACAAVMADRESSAIEGNNILDAGA